MAVDPEIQIFLEQLSAIGFPPLDSLPAPELREYMRAMAAAGPKGPDMARVEDFSAGGVPVRLYVPQAPARAVINYMHGGGWTIGSIAEADTFSRTLAERLGCAVVSVDYRHGPEAPFPGAVDDCFTAARWTADNIGDLLGRTLPLIVCGDSAGGNLSAVISILARDQGGPAIAGQILLNPSTDGDIDAQDLAAFESPFLTKAEIAWFFDQYVPDRAMRTDPRFAPIHAESHAGLPPAIIITAENDLLRAQAEDYGLKLAQAGVTTIIKRYPGAIHSFLAMNSAQGLTAEAFRDIDCFITAFVAP